MARQTVDGVGVTTSETYYPLPPIEFGRAGGTVASVTRVSGGTGYSAGTLSTTDDNPNGSGCTLTVTVTSGVINSTVTVADGGDGYRVGDLLTVTGGGGNATFRVATLSYTN
jgi:hypothetical protein